MTNKNQIKGILNVTPQDTSKLPSYEYLHDLAVNQATKIYMLRQIIDKAIDCIEKNKLNGNKISEMLCGSEIVELLEILKESEENEN